MNPKECVLCVCILRDFADQHIFVYARAECESISLKCTKVKLSTLNNFGSIMFNPCFYFLSLDLTNTKVLLNLALESFVIRALVYQKSKFLWELSNQNPLNLN